MHLCLKFICLFLLVCCHIEGCTRIYCNQDSSHLRFARTMDLFVDDKPQLTVYPRGVLRHGQTADNTKRWKSKYGSAVVTAFHQAFVTDGINEAGFGAHLLFLEEGAFQEKNPDKPALSSFCVAQFLLDNCKTVTEAIEQLTLCQVVGGMLAQKEWPVQIAIEDLLGDSAVVEFIGGKIAVHQGPQYKVVASSGHYESQLNRLKEFQTFGGKMPLPGGADSLSRFVRASSFLETLPKAHDESEAAAGMFSLIRTAQIPFGAKGVWETRWITVGDLSKRVFYFSSAAKGDVIRVDLKQFNLAEGSPVRELI